MTGRPEPAADLVGMLADWAMAGPDDLAFTFCDSWDPSGAPAGEQSLTYGDLLGRAAAVAERVRDLGAPGAPVLLMLPAGLDFICGFFGVMLGGGVAVPIVPPDPVRPQASFGRLRAVARDCRPAGVLTTPALAARRAEIVAAAPDLDPAPWLGLDGRGTARHDPAAVRRVPAEATAFLQYTSGSTADPKGVVVSHANIMANLAAMRRLLGLGSGAVLGGWLPLFHDMGLIGLVLNGFVGRRPCHLITPAGFVQSPARWLDLITRHGVECTGSPNFGYELCARRVPEEALAGVDLSTLAVAYNGAEPVRAATMDRFTRRFASRGFRREAFRPCYGLAEATLIVSGGPGAVGRFDGAALGDGLARPDAGGVPLASSGRPDERHRVVIVGDDGREVPAGRVGEVHVAGPSVTGGYRNRPEDTARAFQRRVPGWETAFLRTGDLGFLHDGELYLCGRTKDLIIHHGRNVYPQDIELTAENAHDGVRAGCVAAYGSPDGDSEAVGIVAEVRPAAFERAAEITREIRLLVHRHHEVPVHRVCLVPPHTIPKTTSGKIRRSSCRTAVDSGAWRPVLDWRRTP
ncbi:fatty acyl-AMP ligase [Actinoplanes oblitus]|uniref:Fatty acyl-AMP ligase n=1 Tax=Actinoplanes oblitus TaxID=3040509 RepID=A0ABY8W9B4_9ACTN|nr:fatty acyl-AMP ligase [Actinoplanes oblitus]WIM94390.1 fatty acyl-AMP ligase [Actinoplanes oblitus]